MAATCPGFDEHGRPFPCDQPPGTPWTTLWCPSCDTRRRARLSQQFADLLSSLNQEPSQ